MDIKIYSKFLFNYFINDWFIHNNRIKTILVTKLEYSLNILTINNLIITNKII
jgi:hypothetical protein